MEKTEQEFDMEETLKSLHFVRNPDTGFKGYFKGYKGYTLWVTHKYSDPLEHWSAFLVIGVNMITIPLLVSPMWVFGFDKENNGYLHDESL